MTSAGQLESTDGRRRLVERDRLRDPVVRKPQGFAENVTANVPWVSPSVQPRQDRFGRDVTRPGGPLRRAADPLNVSPESHDPVLAELGRLDVRVGFPSDRIQGVELTREQRQDLQRMKGQASYRVLDRLLTTEAYRRLNDDQKRKAIKKAVTVARRAASKQARIPVTPRPAGRVGSR